MNMKNTTKNSENKQTIHIDELLSDKQNYQACHNFSVDEELKIKLSDIPYTYTQQHAQQNYHSIPDNKKSWIDQFQFLFQPRYAMLSLVVLIIGVFWFLGKQWIYPENKNNEFLENTSSPAPMIMNYS